MDKALSITRLSSPDRVRLHAPLIFGEDGAFGALRMVLDALRPAAEQGLCSRISVTLTGKNEASVRCLGAALRINASERNGIPAWQEGLCILPLSPRGLPDPTPAQYCDALFGTGRSSHPAAWFNLCCVQCASSRMEITSISGGTASHLLFEAGLPVTSLRTEPSGKEAGTCIRFVPSQEIFGAAPIPLEPIAEYMESLSKAVPGLICTAEDLRDK